MFELHESTKNNIFKLNFGRMRNIFINYCCYNYNDTLGNVEMDKNRKQTLLKKNNLSFDPGLRKFIEKFKLKCKNCNVFNFHFIDLAEDGAATFRYIIIVVGIDKSLETMNTVVIDCRCPARM